MNQTSNGQLNPRVLCTSLYRPLSGINSARLKLNLDDQYKDPKAFLRSTCLFALIGKSDETISIWINDREEFVLDLNNLEKKIIPNEILILENISLKNSSNNKATSGGIVHSFSMIVNSGCSKGGGNVVAFQIDILHHDSEINGLTSTELNNEFKFDLVVPKWSTLCQGRNLVGLRLMNWNKFIGKKKVIDRYLVGLTVDGELIIWEEKNLEKPLKSFNLDVLNGMVIDFELSDNSLDVTEDKNGATLGILDSRHNLKWLSIHVGEKNSITINDLQINLECKSIINKMTSLNSSIFIHEKSNQTHIVSNQSIKTIDGTFFREIESNNELIIKWAMTRDGMYICVVKESNEMLILERTEFDSSPVLYCISLFSSTNTNKHFLPLLSKRGEFTQIIPNNLLSRFLYTNPVCILSSNYENQRNLMTITWLTPTDNSAHFVCSMNKSRHSASLVLKSKQFALNIPTLPLANHVLKIGGCTGSEVDKFRTFVNTYGDNSTDKPLTLIERRNSSGIFYCFEECCAHLCCVIEKELEDSCPGHYLFYCRIVEGFVKDGYWKDGKQFIHTNESHPPYLTFLGSQEFALTKHE